MNRTVVSIFLCTIKCLRFYLSWESDIYLREAQWVNIIYLLNFINLILAAFPGLGMDKIAREAVEQLRKYTTHIGS